MAAYLIGLGHPVVGADSSPAMIDACRRHFPTQDWIVADMRKLALQRKFSGILAWTVSSISAMTISATCFRCFVRMRRPGRR